MRDFTLCKHCGVKKTRKNTYLGTNKNGFQTICKKCMSVDQKRRRKLSPETFKGNLLNCRFGITLEQWHQMMSNQLQKCKICSVALEKSQRPSVDHDHETGKIRGILCQYCNTLLGHHEKIERLGMRELFIKYLGSKGRV